MKRFIYAAPWKIRAGLSIATLHQKAAIGPECVKTLMDLIFVEQ